MPQISRGKFDRLPRTTAGSTTSELDGYGLRGHWPARPSLLASYPVLVHGLALLLHASFRPRLAASVVSPLRFAMTSPPSGCQRDFHPQAVEHARHTKKKTASARGLKLKVGTETTRAVSLVLRRVARGCSRLRCCRLCYRLDRRATRGCRWHTRLRVVGFNDRLRDVDGRSVPDHGTARPLLGCIEDHPITVIGRVLHDERSHLGEDFVSDFALLVLVILLRVLGSAIQALFLGLNLLYQFVA